MKYKYHFSGYVTKNDITCTDGRVIRHAAFKHQDGQEVALVWNHGHDDVENVLGKVLLEHRDDGVYGYATFNDTDKGKHAKEMVKHGGVKAMSIFANQLKQTGVDVMHGMIREVSLVLAGANSGALIDFIAHSDNADIIHSAKIFQDLGLEERDGGEVEFESITHGDQSGGKSVQEVIDSMTDEQKNVMNAMVAKAAEENSSVQHNNQNGSAIQVLMGGSEVKHNVFDTKEDTIGGKQTKMSPEKVKEIMHAANKRGSLRDTMIMHADSYGIKDIESLFPDFKTIMKSPEIIARRMEWVNEVLPKTTKKPFTRLKTVHADITKDEARAKGYMKGYEKFEQVIELLSRETSAQMVYIKQKLDREDILEITDFDVVAFLKAEMRVLLDEELSRAILIGDGRDLQDEQKIKPSKIRPIWGDEQLYAHHTTLPGNSTPVAIVEAIIRGRKHYKGAGSPVMFSTSDFVTDMLLAKNNNGDRYYKNIDELKGDLRVSKIVEVEVMENRTRIDADNKTLQLHSIIVNMRDYYVGAPRKGKVDTFEDFDIDFNQQKYLMETFMSGSLMHPKSALVFELDITAG